MVTVIHCWRSTWLKKYGQIWRRKAQVKEGIFKCVSKEELKSNNAKLVLWQLMKKLIRLLVIYLDQSLRTFIQSSISGILTSSRNFSLKHSQTNSKKWTMRTRKLRTSKYQQEGTSKGPLSHRWWLKKQSYKLKGRLLKF